MDSNTKLISVLLQEDNIVKVSKALYYILKEIIMRHKKRVVSRTDHNCNFRVNPQ